MSLQINMCRIVRVLLADGWHDCKKDTFGLDSYEFGTYYKVSPKEWSTGIRFDCQHGGGNSGVCPTGFAFTDATTGETISGPLTAILAVIGKDLTKDPKPTDRDVH